LWYRFGRDPYGGPMVVQYDPPDNLTGSEAGAMIDERVDQRDIVAAIVALAVKGYLKISVQETGHFIKHSETSLIMTDKKPEGDLQGIELSIYTRLKKKEVHDESDLRTELGPHIQQYKDAVYAQLVQRGYYHASPQAVRAAWTVGGLVVVAVLAIFAGKLDPVGNPLPAIVGGIISAVIVAIFGNAMPKRTAAGAKARALVEGFREFIRRARGQELKWMEKKHPDMMLFESYLPHAIAFGLGDVWCEAFKDYLQKPPEWFVGPPNYPFTYMMFSNSLNGVTSSLASAAVPPRSSGA